MHEAAALDDIAGIVAVLLMAAATAVTRVGGVWIMSYVKITPRIEAFLKYMSVSVLISIVVPAVWTAEPHVWLAVAVAALVMIATRNAVGAMLTGTALAAFAKGFGL